MPKIQNPPLWVSQNFLTSSYTIKRIIRISSICKTDRVVEIGAGKGHITKFLLEKSGGVTALEMDRRLFSGLRKKFATVPDLRLVCADFLKWNLPKTPYKVFANIPFCQTTEIIKKLTGALHPPEEAWLVIEKGAAKRFSGKPHETPVSLGIKPFFDCEIKYYFKKEDFHPAPSVDAVLFHLKRKTAPDITPEDRSRLNRFITASFAHPKGVFSMLTKKQIATALKKENLPRDIPSSGAMLYVQWLCLFRCFLKHGRH